MFLDDGGVYKGRLNQRERVREIEDTRDTKVELPVDFREVETVEVNSSIEKTRKSYSFIFVFFFRKKIFTAMLV